MTFYVVEESAEAALTGGPRHQEWSEALSELESLDESMAGLEAFAVYQVTVSQIHPSRLKQKPTEN